MMQPFDRRRYRLAPDGSLRLLPILKAAKLLRTARAGRRRIKAERRAKREASR